MVTFLTGLLTDNGVNILIAATAARRAYREAARARIARFAEAYVHCSPEECRVRDPKGLWARADRGEITNLPGRGVPYEAPDVPEARVDTARHSAEVAAHHILKQLDDRGFLADSGFMDSTSRVGAERKREGGAVMFERILLATDGSPDAGQALEYARDLALRDGAQVIVVHAFEPVRSRLGDPWGTRIMERHVSAGQDVANQAAQTLQAAGVDIVVEVIEGPPADAVLRVARVRQPDLIVMGSRGHGTLASLLLGSVSHRVLAHTSAPVMVVKATGQGTE
jgi:nucleotide-binding universal stress UspA family protein